MSITQNSVYNQNEESRKHRFNIFMLAVPDAEMKLCERVPFALRIKSVRAVCDSYSFRFKLKRTYTISGNTYTETPSAVNNILVGTLGVDCDLTSEEGGGWYMRQGDILTIDTNLVDGVTARNGLVEIFAIRETYDDYTT
jgi:hypothetical protein